MLSNLLMNCWILLKSQVVSTEAGFAKQCISIPYRSKSSALHVACFGTTVPGRAIADAKRHCESADYVNLVSACLKGGYSPEEASLSTG